MRGYDYLQFIGNKAFFSNAELRFPIIEAALTPLGVVGGLRGVAFANFGASQVSPNRLNVWDSHPVNVVPIVNYNQDFITGAITPVYGQPTTISGFRLVDGEASYGIGLETFALGFPIHFDWAWRTLFNKAWEDYQFAYQATINGYSSGSTWFRKPHFSVWIGYDF